MSILVVHLVPQGLIFCADRNITATRRNGVLLLRGQTQRPKVLKWPNRDAIVGYVGQARIGTVETDEWLYSFIGRNVTFPDFDVLADALTNDLNAAMQAGEITGDVTLHLGGFEQVNGEWTPRIWFIRNTTALTPTGPILGQSFVRSEEIAQPGYFGGKTGNQIRLDVANRVNHGGLFSFRQGYDLAAFNAIDQGLRAAMQMIVQGHPLGLHPFPSTLEEWAKHVRMSVLGYSAYFGAFYAAYEQYVGGGADEVHVPWP
jgi:hypothetical protein